jgi:hypothetical protein
MYNYIVNMIKYFEEVSKISVDLNVLKKRVNKMVD